MRFVVNLKRLPFIRSNPIILLSNLSILDSGSRNLSLNHAHSLPGSKPVNIVLKSYSLSRFLRNSSTFLHRSSYSLNAFFTASLARVANSVGGRVNEGLKRTGSFQSSFMLITVLWRLSIKELCPIIISFSFKCFSN